MIYFKSRGNKVCNGFVSEKERFENVKKLTAVLKVFKEPWNKLSLWLENVEFD